MKRKERLRKERKGYETIKMTKMVWMRKEKRGK